MMEKTATTAPVTKAVAQSTTSQSVSKSMLFSVLNKIDKIHLTLVDQTQNEPQIHYFGKPTAKIHADVQFCDPQAYSQILKNGAIGAAEAYIQGHWQSSNLTKLIEAFVVCQNELDAIEAKTSWLTKLKNTILHWKNRNTINKSKQNILAHYDLGNELYQGFLDRDMMYSSAIYPTEESNLDEAQQHKLDTICQRLELKPGERLLEIGTGWGGLAIYAASHYGCEVTTTTISQAQFQYAEKRIEALGLENKITLIKQDYRRLKGRYDKLVSIEMIEAVGHEYYGTFFEQCNKLLKPGGKMLIQAITIADQRFEHYKHNVDFIQRHIFPGGCLPSIEIMTRHLRKDTDMVLESLHDIGLDYAKTLRDWRVKFNENWPSIKPHGFDERFKRLWNFYFCYCEGAFVQRATSTVHFIARK